jgi:uncharacterized protein (DUF2126 family)/transglutaminase-like putative cysteine protease
MSIHVGITHQTNYKFDRPVRLSPHVVRLRPAPHTRTPILSYSLNVSPADHFVNWQQDPFGNYLARFVFPEPMVEFDVTVDLVADMTVINPFEFFIDDDAKHYPFAYEIGLQRDLSPYLAALTGLPLLDGWMEALQASVPGMSQMPLSAQTPQSPDSGLAVIDFLVQLNSRLCTDIAYSIRMEPGVQTPDETLQARLGSCRDTAWLLVQILRRLGLAARFVSGYLVQLRADVEALDGPSGPASDFTDLHAWAEVYVPGAGWIGLDPTSGLFAGEGHIPLAATPEPSSAAAITGMVDPCETTMTFSNVVTRVREDPRVTLPYSPDQWNRIDALGQHVDELLSANDVRLTMGGEPTFVSAKDMEAAEWTVAADGPAKRVAGAEMARRLAEHYAPGGIVHHGQGKWYPGEPLPRWQIALFWRTDGAPIWNDPKLLVVDPSTPGSASIKTAATYCASAAELLGISPEFVLPAYEDPLVQVLHEAQLPLGTPAEFEVLPAALAGGASARMELVRKLDESKGAAIGFVIPVHRPPGETTRWGTTKWHLRRGALFLLPGDSAVGLRLPLGSLTWAAVPTDEDRSPFDEYPDLPMTDQTGSKRVANALVVSSSTCPSTALSVEVRNGHLHVFLPPFVALEDALSMLSVLEHAAEICGEPIVLEGYPLPRDPRIQTLVVAPDPGVLEINIHPANTWRELVEITETVHKYARLSSLATETFQIDGRHSGTGGGNHITIGAARAKDSPLLRRPDLLRSMVTYWQNHPSLSYLFSGRFIGPTSQSPRVDEGRHETLYELEIAFAELDRLEEMKIPERDPSPWLIDRLLRHLLTDITGNTHRAEFCIDKLFSPDSERGRLGLLELRGFEMPPHPQMALVQNLLVRALIVRMWTEPYREDLVRWGTDLHDRFLLPHYCEQDIHDIVADLQTHKVGFDPAWIAPFLEFRFPRLGTVTLGDVHLELRAAIEPWHVLGEEVAATGTARYVDSSVERLQVKVTGLTDGRHRVTCNGEIVPLRSTGTPGESVAGVRYRAWQPPSALHPTIGVHSPLRFDVVDTWNQRSMGGCTYHVAHPGGVAFDDFPVNANAAEARRRSRFATVGHTPGRIDLEGQTDLSDPRDLRSPGRRAGISHGEYPRTLDLRRVPFRTA